MTMDDLPDPGFADGMRKVALVLRAVAPVDRRWLLRSIPEEYHAGIETMVSELDALGMSRERAVVREVLALQATRRPTGHDSDARLAPHQLFQVVRTEPAAVAALVVWLCGGEMQGDAMAALPADGRHALQEALSELSRLRHQPPKLRAAAAAEVRSVTVAPVSVWRRVLGTLRSSRPASTGERHAASA